MAKKHNKLFRPIRSHGSQKSVKGVHGEVGRDEAVLQQTMMDEEGKSWMMSKYGG